MRFMGPCDVTTPKAVINADFSWQIQSGGLESGSLFNIYTWRFVVHSTEAFHLNLKFIRKFPRVSHLVGTAVIMNVAPLVMA